MRKTDTRQWQYVEPLLKCEYDLVIRGVDRNVYANELREFRVQSIKLNKKGKIEVVIKAPSNFDEKGE